MKTRIFGFLAFIVLSITNVAASEKVIATIKNDENNMVYNLVVETHDEREIKNFFKDTYKNGSRVAREKLDHNVMLRSGMVLEKRDKYEVIKLRSQNFDTEQGGVVIVDTLFNGANGARKTYEVELSQSKSGWAIFNNGKAVKEIMIQTNKVMILGTVGIKNLVMK